MDVKTTPSPEETKADVELPQISMDYAQIGNDQEEGEARKLLVGRDRQSKFTFSIS